MTAKEAAIIVLKNAGKPLTLKEITNKILSEGLWKTESQKPMNTLSTTLRNHCDGDGGSSVFVLTAPNTFALRGVAESHKIAPKSHSDKFTFLKAAEHVLEQIANQKPMHYQDITDIAIEQGWLTTSGKTPKNTMNAYISKSINRFNEMKKDGKFTRYSPGFYGLTSWLGTGLSRAIKKKNLEVQKELLSHINKMDPTRVEKIVSDLLYAMGLEEVTLTKPSNDNGIDVIGFIQLDDVIRIKMVVQVKRWKNNVTRPVIHKLRGCIGNHAQGLLVTTSDFSKGAREDAKRLDSPQILLMNGKQFANLLTKHNLGVHRTEEHILEIDEEFLSANNVPSQNHPRKSC